MHVLCRVHVTVLQRPRMQRGTSVSVPGCIGRCASQKRGVRRPGKLCVKPWSDGLACIECTHPYCRSSPEATGLHVHMHMHMHASREPSVQTRG